MSAVLGPVRALHSGWTRNCSVAQAIFEFTMLLLLGEILSLAFVCLFLRQHPDIQPRLTSNSGYSCPSFPSARIPVV